MYCVHLSYWYYYNSILLIDCSLSATDWLFLAQIPDFAWKSEHFISFTTKLLFPVHYTYNY